MINIDPIYLVSQLITVIYYGFLVSTYYVKTQKSIIILNSLSLILNIVAYILLGAWTGLLMCAVALVRNLIRYHAEVKGSKFGISKSFFILLLLAIVGVTIPTYDGFLSLMSVFATAIYSYAVWQKKPAIYKLCGLPVGILWIIYNVYVGSLLGWILEAVLLGSVIVSLIRDHIKRTLLLFLKLD